jgi:hypothetical protein
MTNLKELQVRMPQSFDRVGSWSLCKLLSPKRAWRMFGYADERGHMQTREDVLHHVADDFKLHTHAAQEKVWPSGRFVRRTWALWTAEPPDTTEVALHRGTGDVESPTSHPSANNGNTVPPKTYKLAGEKREREQLKKAIKQARETARKEEELEASLPPVEPRCPMTRDPATVSRTEDIERRLTGIYGRHIRSVAQRTWRAKMRGHIEQLQYRESAREETVNNTYKAGRHSETSEATAARNVLRDTRELLQKRMQYFRPEEIFAPCDRMDRTNGLKLVKNTTNYAVEESKRRAGPAKEGTGRTGTSTSNPSSTAATTGALPSEPQQPRSNLIEISSESSGSESTSLDEDDPQLVEFNAAVSTQQITATQTVTAQQRFQAVHTSQTTQAIQKQQQAHTAQQLELTQQLANKLAAGQAQKAPRFGKDPDKELNKGKRASHKTPVDSSFAQNMVNGKAAEETRRSGEQAAGNQGLLKEKEAAVAKAEAEDKAKVAAEMVAEAAEHKAAEEKKKAEEVKKQNTEIERQAAAEKNKAKEIEAAAKKKTTDEKAARKIAEQKAKEVAEATKEAAVKAQEAAATIKAVDNKDTPDVISTIEKTPPTKPVKRPTKSPKTPKGKSPKTPKGTKRKEVSPNPSDGNFVDKSPSTKKPRSSKQPPMTSTPTRHSSRIRKQTPTTQVQLPSDVSVTESSEGDTDDGDKPKGRKKGKKEPESADEYGPSGSTKKNTPTRGAKAARGRGKAAGRDGKAAGAAKAKRRAAANEDEEEEDGEIVRKKPVKKKPRRAKKVDED